ncbi:MAG: ComEA family DNA-binding protein [Janthinobacterium lividum]
MYRINWIVLFVILFIGRAALAGTNVNTADEAALQSVSGLGASKAETIVAERNAHGPFKDADDLAARIKGLGEKSVKRLQEHGLEITAPAPVKGTRKAPARKARAAQPPKASKAGAPPPKK